MPLIIDGNNLLHAPMPTILAGLDEARLCRLLAAGPWRGRRMVVVCDGAPGPMREVESPENAVELVHSGPNKTADDLIIAMVDKDSAPRRLVVVSNDRQIQRAARRRRSKVCSCEQFIRQLVAIANAEAAGRANPQKPRRPAPGSLDANDVDAWLKEFGLDGDQPIDETDQPWTDLEID